MNNLKLSEKNSENESFIKDFLSSVLKEIMSVIHAECGSLFLFDSKHEELILDSFYNSGNLHIKGLKKRIGEGISGKVANIKTPVLVKNIDNDSRFHRNGFNHYRTKSFISLPVFTSQKLVGLINLADKSTDEYFSDDDLAVAITILKHACMALESSSSCNWLKQEKDDLHKQKVLLEKYASVGKLAAGIVHEVNNPLDGILRYTNMLLEQAEDNSVSRDYLSEIKKGLCRIANITKSLLEFSHQVNSASSHNKKYIDLHLLIDESLDALRHKINGNIQIKKNYSKQVLRVLDFGMQHVIANIIKNALDAMPTGGKLEITTGLKDSMIEIKIKDAGIGIPREILEHIFEPFFTTKSMDKGTGLGLAICREIVNRYEGAIEVKSLPGEGSNFTILIDKKYLENA